MTIQIKRLPHRLEPNPERVITRFFSPGDVGRIKKVIQRALELPEDDLLQLTEWIAQRFISRHKDLRSILKKHYDNVKHHVNNESKLNELQRLAIGACFTMEFSIESTALFNPSMVPANTQDGVPPGSMRFLISLRATGEGHLSSIVFRNGIVDPDGNIVMEPQSPYSWPLEATEAQNYQRHAFRQDLITCGAMDNLAARILSELPETFTLEQLFKSIDDVRQQSDTTGRVQEVAENMLSILRANYELHLPKGMEASEIVIFPNSENESRGIEDLRLVLFKNDDDSTCYYGTYTAYNGFRIVPQLLEYAGRRIMKIHTLSGRCARNKGLALFPRKINGAYVMVSRIDNENLYLMESDNIRVWQEARLLKKPRFSWEIIQIGNCGSPLETSAGWLLLTHGVGPMRQYFIGATLLDLKDPLKIIGQTKEPLLIPTEQERIGYVPNVVYSCGGMIYNSTLIIPYAMSDVSTRFATVSLKDLLNLL